MHLQTMTLVSPLLLVARRSATHVHLGPSQQIHTSNRSSREILPSHLWTVLGHLLDLKRPALRLDPPLAWVHRARLRRASVTGHPIGMVRMCLRCVRMGSDRLLVPKCLSKPEQQVRRLELPPQPWQPQSQTCWTHLRHLRSSPSSVRSRKNQRQQGQRRQQEPEQELRVSHRSTSQMLPQLELRHHNWHRILPRVLSQPSKRLNMRMLCRSARSL